MARSRNIKPGFFTNDELAECGPLAQIMFAGLWTIADRAGRLRDRPKKIKAETLPYYDADADELLNTLTAHGFIERYISDKDSFIQIVNWDKHQNPHKNEATSSIPAPESHHTSTVQVPESHNTNPADSLNTDSGFPLSAAIATTKTKRATQIAEDFSVDDEMTNWALAKGFSFQEIDEQTERFINHAIANSRTQVDWKRSWQNWMTSPLNKQRGSPNGAHKNKAQDQMDMLIRQGRGERR